MWKISVDRLIIFIVSGQVTNGNLNEVNKDITKSEINVAIRTANKGKAIGQPLVLTKYHWRC